MWDIFLHMILPQKTGIICSIIPKHLKNWENSQLKIHGGICHIL